MFTKLFFSGSVILALGLAAVQSLAGGVAGTLPCPVETSPEELVLRYKFPAGQLLRYERTSETREFRDLMGQTIETVLIGKNAYSFRAKGRKEDNHLLEVTIDDKTLTATSDFGDLSPDLNSVRGKSFDMILSPLGVEVDVSGAESLTFELGGRTRNLADEFKLYFPDLPDKPVRIGDFWPTSFTIKDTSDESNRRTEIQIVSTLEAIETVDGIECARINGKLTGRISGTGSQQGHELLFEGTVKGTDVWYFATKEGIFLKSTSDAVSEIIVSVSGAQNMTIPMTQKQKGEVKWTGRL